MTDSKRIPSLDGFRAIAILMVVYCHLPYYRAGRFANSIFDWGMLGVFIFFVISGFLITTLLQRERERTGEVSLRDFYIRRIFRIFPPLLFFLFGTWVLARAGLANVSARALVFSLSFLRNYHPGPYRILHHLWSLSVEEQFYLAWPFLFTHLTRRSATRLLWIVVLVVPMIRMATVLFVGHAMDGNTEQVADGLAWGCLLAIKQKELRGSHFYQWLNRSGAALLLPWIIVGASYSFPQLARQGIAKTVIFASAALAMDMAMLRFRSWPAAILNFRPLAWIGRISYSLYLWQQVFLLVRSSDEPYARFPVNLGLALLCSISSYYLIELPAIGFGRRIIQNRAQRAVAPVTCEVEAA